MQIKINSFMASFMFLFISYLGIANCNQEAFKNTKDSKEKEILESILKSAKQNHTLKKRSKKEVQDMLNLLPNESRVYVMRGSINDNIYDAYVKIGSLYNSDFVLDIVFPSLYNKLDFKNEIITFSLNECEIGLDDSLFIKCVKKQSSKDSIFSKAEFIATTCNTCNLHEIDFISSFFEDRKKTKNGNFSYINEISLPFIPENNQIKDNVRSRINTAMKASGDKYIISKSLAKKTKEGFRNFKFDFNAEYINNVNLAYVSSKLLMFIENHYIYEGGAHGNTILSTRAFLLQNGEELATNIEELFDMQKQNEILALLTKKLKYQKDKLYDLPLHTMPDIFVFDDSGVILMWQLYKIAPYSSGIIKVHINFKELAPFVKKDSVYSFLF